MVLKKQWVLIFTFLVLAAGYTPMAWAEPGMANMAASRIQPDVVATEKAAADLKRNRLMNFSGELFPRWIKAWEGFLTHAGEASSTLARSGFGMHRDRPLDVYQNEQVRKFVGLYRNEFREEFERGLERSRVYLPMIQRIFLEEGVPRELSYLAIVESNLNPSASSHKRAVGLWQFIKPTAVYYGLRVENPWYDERLDPELSTRAAARMLSRLYDRYGSWELALAAYNAGMGRVDKAIRKSMAKGGEGNFWALKLPKETKSYVPAFLAAAIVYDDLEQHGFVQVEPEPQKRYELVRGAHYTSIRELSRRLNLEEGELRRINPSWRHHFMPELDSKAGDGVVVRLPVGYADRLAASLKANPLTGPGLVEHKVKPGETVRGLASFYGVKTADLMALNQLKGSGLLVRGKKIRIPLTHDDLNAYSVVSAEGQKRGDAPLRYRHRVRQGESLSTIAKLYRVSPAQVVSWNNLSTTNLEPHTNLVVYLPPDKGYQKTAL